MTPGILIWATGRMELPFNRMWKTEKGKVWGKIKQSILHIWSLKYQLDIQTEKLNRQLDQWIWNTESRAAPSMGTSNEKEAATAISSD